MYPIVSSCGTATYNTAKFFTKILHNYCGKTSSFVKDSTDFIKKIKHLSIYPEEEILVSFDVSALFTSIPVPVALQVIHSKISTCTNLSNILPYQQNPGCHCRQPPPWGQQVGICLAQVRNSTGFYSWSNPVHHLHSTYRRHMQKQPCWIPSLCWRHPTLPLIQAKYIKFQTRLHHQDRELHKWNQCLDDSKPPKIK